MRSIKNIRLKHYDYRTNGYYFVTLCSNHRRYVVAQFIGLIKKTMEEMHKLNGAKLDYYHIMPDHLHMIIILENSQFSLGEIVRRLKAITNKKAGIKLWQPNYYEHVIRTEEALKEIRKYIQNNPLAEKIDFKQFYLKHA